MAVLVTVVSSQPARPGLTGAALVPAFHYAFLTAAAVIAIAALIALTIRDADAAATMRRPERIPAAPAPPPPVRDLRAAGKSQRDIADHLNATGRKQPGGTGG